MNIFELIKNGCKPNDLECVWDQVYNENSSHTTTLEHALRYKNYECLKFILENTVIVQNTYEEWDTKRTKLINAFLNADKFKPFSFNTDKFKPFTEKKSSFALYPSISVLLSHAIEYDAPLEIIILLCEKYNADPCFPSSDISALGDAIFKKRHDVIDYFLQDEKLVMYENPNHDTQNDCFTISTMWNESRDANIALKIFLRMYEINPTFGIGRKCEDLWRNMENLHIKPRRG